jgi:CBS domain-containing protein
MRVLHPQFAFVKRLTKNEFIWPSQSEGHGQMTTVRQLLKGKGHKVFTVSPDQTVLDAIRKMADENIGSLVVCEGTKPIGIITERHYARNVFLKGRASPSTLVRDVMETNVLYATPDQTAEECMAVMTEKRIRHLPVIDQEKLIGIISIGDLVKDIISDQKFTIDQLINLIRT